MTILITGAGGRVGHNVLKQFMNLTKPGTIYRQFEQIIGKPSRTFAEWVSDHASDF